MLKPPTPTERIGTIVLVAAFCASTYLAWRGGAYLALVVLIPLDLLFIWGAVDMLRQGVRRPTPFERFEEQLLRRFVLIFFGGGAAVALLYRAGEEGIALLLLAVVLAVSLFYALKFRGRHETSAGYKHRVGYRDPEEH